MAYYVISHIALSSKFLTAYITLKRLTASVNSFMDPHITSFSERSPTDSALVLGNPSLMNRSDVNIQTELSSI